MRHLKKTDMVAINRIVTIGLFALMFTGCDSIDKKNSSTENLVSMDSLHLYSLYTELLSTEINNDTLKIVTTAPFTYFPLEKFSTINDFIKKHKIFTVKEEYQYHEDDSSNLADTVYNLTYEKSVIRLFHDYEEQQVHIVSGAIINKGITLTNGIEIGQSKTFVINKFFSKLPRNYERIKVIEIESGLIGIWHYYDFNKGELIRIMFDTDYLLK